MKTTQQYPTVALKLVGMKNITCNLMTRSDHLKYEKTSCITLLRPELISNPHTMCVLKSAHLCMKIWKCKTIPRKCQAYLSFIMHC